MHSVHFSAFFYALRIVHDTSSKNAKLSSATTSFPWRHTATSKNHGYNAFADDSCRTQNCRLLQRHFRDVTLTAARITDITLSWTACAGTNFVSRIRHSIPAKKVKKIEEIKLFESYIPYGLFQTKGEKCANFGSDRFRNVNLYKVQTNKQTFRFIYKIVKVVLDRKLAHILLFFLLLSTYTLQPSRLIVRCTCY